MTQEQLPLPAEWIAAAAAAAANAYAPYSEFRVGAALIHTDGAITTGHNIENASYSATICAERVAASAAIAGGRRDDWRAIVIVSPSGVSPCGVCRQFLSEFGLGLAVYWGQYETAPKHFHAATLAELLPGAMRPIDVQ